MAPNLLFVTLDQLRADAVFGALHGIVPTPALDRLRAEGVSFTNCFTAAVPCGPARASLLTGLYAFNHRGIRNGTPVARHHATLATELRRAGAEPLLFGYCDMAADPSEHPPGDPDLATYELPARGFREIVEMRFEAPLAWIGHLRRRGYDLPSPQPQRWFDLYQPVGEGLRAPAPAPTGPDHPFRSAWFSAPAQHGLFRGFDGRCDRLTPDQVADLRATYLGLVAEVDHHLGRLLDWLDTTGQAGRTLIVLLSDHGEMLGDHGYWGKDNVLCPAHHVPLVMRGPGVAAGREVADMVSTVDVAPTILDLMGAEVPPAMDGASLVPFLHGTRPEDWRGLSLTEIDLAEPNAPTRFERALGLNPLTANAAILRDATHSLVHFNGSVPPMLFDRRNDPAECHDLASTPKGAAEVARLRAALLDLRMTRADRRLTHLSHLP
jgi:arylsulfatase A-like enzyme